MNTTEPFCRLVRDGQTATLFLLGTWQLAQLGPIDAALAAEDLPASRVTLDGSSLDTLDTAATLALLRRVVAAGASIEQLANFKQTHAEVIDVVRARMDESAIEPARRRRGALATLGVQAFELRDLLAGHLDFLGRSACELANVALRPHTLRLRALTAQFGTMLLTEEIDAIRTLGLSPMRVLVVPRLVALAVALPLLVFVGDV